MTYLSDAHARLSGWLNENKPTEISLHAPSAQSFIDRRKYLEELGYRVDQFFYSLAHDASCHAPNKIDTLSFLTLTQCALHDHSDIGALTDAAEQLGEEAIPERRGSRAMARA